MMEVQVTVPATSANLGPGFDSIGLALRLYNRVTFTAVPSPGLTITASGLDAHKIPTDPSNLIYRCAKIIFDKVDWHPPGLHINQENNIPVSSGLGSSSTCVLAGMLGANALSGERFTREEILQFAYELEGHPDNVAPALLGGLVLGVAANGSLHIENLNIPDLEVIVILPDVALLTREARAALPAKISRQDAIFNASRTPLLLCALQQANYDLLALAMQDRLHQPYRIPLIPGMAQAFAAAVAAGARGVALSGAGPSLIAFTPDRHEAICEAVTAVFAAAGIPARHWVLAIDRLGCQLERISTA